MRSKSLTVLCLLAATVSLGGCAVGIHKPAVQESRMVDSGTRSKVAYFYNLKGNCQQDGVPQVTVTTPPRNGAVTIGAGNNLPQYPPDNGMAVCNQQPVGTAEVLYQSNPNFRGADHFAIQVRYSSSYSQAYTYDLTVN